MAIIRVVLLYRYAHPVGPLYILIIDTSDTVFVRIREIKFDSWECSISRAVYKKKRDGLCCQAASTSNLHIVTYITYILTHTHSKCMHSIPKISQGTVTKIK